jgi:dTDP-glucose 4,6-dehydratase
MNEAHPLNPVSPYAASKVATDRIAYAFHLSKHLPVTVVRPFNAYGPLQHPEKMIPLFITRLLRDKPISLNHGGKQKRDWVFIEDHARAIEAIIKSPPEKVLGKVFNIGTGKSTSVADVARLILKTLKKSEKKYLQIAQSSAPETSGNVGISKHLEKTLGWTAKTPLEKGIKATVKWYIEHESWWSKFVE